MGGRQKRDKHSVKRVQKYMLIICRKSINYTLTNQRLSSIIIVIVV